MSFIKMKRLILLQNFIATNFLSESLNVKQKKSSWIQPAKRGRKIGHQRQGIRILRPLPCVHEVFVAGGLFAPWISWREFQRQLMQREFPWLTIVLTNLEKPT
jgi:hypothetical protein